MKVKTGDGPVEQVARAMCGRDLEWRDCERACLASGKCVGRLSESIMEDARAAIAALSGPWDSDVVEAVDRMRKWSSRHSNVTPLDGTDRDSPTFGDLRQLLTIVPPNPTMTDKGE